MHMGSSYLPQLYVKVWRKLSNRKVHGANTEPDRNQVSPMWVTWILLYGLFLLEKMDITHLASSPNAVKHPLCNLEATAIADAQLNSIMTPSCGAKHH